MGISELTHETATATLAQSSYDELNTRLTNAQCDIIDLRRDLDWAHERIDKLTTLFQRSSAAPRARSSKLAGGRYRERLIELFSGIPRDMYLRPGEIAKRLNLDWHQQVPLAQACKGLMKEGVLKTRENTITKRAEYAWDGD